MWGAAAGGLREGIEPDMEGPSADTKEPSSEAVKLDLAGAG